MKAETSDTKRPFGLNIWVVFDHPKDFPNDYVVRQFVYDMPTGEHYHHTDLDNVREWVRKRGLKDGVFLHRINRCAMDEPTIVECWL